MERYTLTNEGRARFRGMGSDLNSAEHNTERYKILKYLYENGSGTVKEIEDFTGLSRQQLMDELQTVMSHGYIEKLLDH
ncbi:MarR family transcriptional regulator [Chloroflexota bacterium]